MDTNGHEWTRMGGREPRNTRMDTNGWEGATKHTKGTKGEYRATNGHELSSFPLLFKGILHITNWKSKSYIFGTFEGLRKTGNSHFFDKTLIFDSNLDKTLTFTPLPA